MPKKNSAPEMFALFERVVMKLYDGGVLSPAVLERVIGVFAQAGVDWSAHPGERSVDGRLLHEIVVLTMMPGQSLRSASASFAKVVARIGEALPASTGTRAGRNEENSESQDHDENDENDENLLAQLTTATRPASTRRKKKDPQAAGNAKGFNPFLNAAPPRSKKS